MFRLINLIPFLVMFSVSSVADTAPPPTDIDMTLDLNCTAKLYYVSADPSAKPIVLSIDSGPTILRKQPAAEINFAPYRVNAFVGMTIAGTDRHNIQAFLEVELFKGSPNNTVNFARVDGLDLADRSVGMPLNVSGINFLSVPYGGQNISRVDYNCALSRVQ